MATNDFWKEVDESRLKDALGFIKQSEIQQFHKTIKYKAVETENPFDNMMGSELRENAVNCVLAWIKELDSFNDIYDTVEKQKLEGEDASENFKDKIKKIRENFGTYKGKKINSYILLEYIFDQKHSEKLIEYSKIVPLKVKTFEYKLNLEFDWMKRGNSYTETEILNYLYSARIAWALCNIKMFYAKQGGLDGETLDQLKESIEYIYKSDCYGYTVSLPNNFGNLTSDEKKIYDDKQNNGDLYLLEIFIERFDLDLEKNFIKYRWRGNFEGFQIYSIAINYILVNEMKPIGLDLVYRQYDNPTLEDKARWLTEWIYEYCTKLDLFEKIIRYDIIHDMFFGYYNKLLLSYHTDGRINVTSDDDDDDISDTSDSDSDNDNDDADQNKFFLVLTLYRIYIIDKLRATIISRKINKNFTEWGIQLALTLSSNNNIYGNLRYRKNDILQKIENIIYKWTPSYFNVDQFKFDQLFKKWITDHEIFPIPNDLFPLPPKILPPESSKHIKNTDDKLGGLNFDKSRILFDCKHFRTQNNIQPQRSLYLTPICLTTNNNKLKYTQMLNSKQIYATHKKK